MIFYTILLHNFLQYIYRMVNLASFMGQSSGVTLSVNDECVRRIVSEAKNYIHDPHVAVEIFPGKSKYASVF